MTNDLKQLLHDSTADAPAEPHSVHDIVRSAQRSHRRHTVRLVGGSVLALALVAGVGYAAVVNGGKDDAQPAHTGPEPIRVDVKDARKAVPGEDYESLGVLDPGLASSTLTWRPDDLVTVRQGKGWAAVSGADGKSVTDLPVPDGGTVPQFVGQGHAVWWVESDDRTVVLHVQDLANREWAEVPVEFEGSDQVGDGELLGVEGGRVFVTFEVASAATASRFAILSAPADGSDGFRREVDSTISSARLADGNLAWVSDFDQPVRVKDLATGEEQEFEATPASREKCAVQVLGLSAERIASQYRCDGTQPKGAGETHVWSLKGGPTIVLAEDTWIGYAIEAALSDEALMLQDVGMRRVRTYVYRFDTDEVLDLGAVKQDKFGTASLLPVRAGGDRIIFPSPGEKGELAALK